jgi:hypothetical protein
MRRYEGVAPIPSWLRRITADACASSKNVWQYTRQGVVDQGAGRYILSACALDAQENAKGVVAAAGTLSVGRGD